MDHQRNQAEITKDLALELEEFFIGTYAEKALQAARESGNTELLLITVNHFDNLKWQVLNAEASSRKQPEKDNDN